MKKLRIVVLISGRGSNFRAIAEAAHPNVEIAAVISNRPDAAGLVYAEEKGITAEVVDHKQYKSRESFDQVLQQRIDAYEADLVVLAGFMRILSAPFIVHYQGRLLNIHPSLLPKYKGLHTHRRALEAGDKEHGVSVHFVTEDLDAGPVVAQARIKINAEDNEESLAQRLLVEEHHLYPKVVHWIAEQRVKLVAGEVLLDNQPVDLSVSS